MRAAYVAGMVALATAGAIGVYATVAEDDEAHFCNADALGGPNGELYGRSGDLCQFVGENGEVLTEIPATGEPLCYGTLAGAKRDPYGGSIVDCDHPGPGLVAHRPEP